MKALVLSLPLPLRLRRVRKVSSSDTYGNYLRIRHWIFLNSNRRFVSNKTPHVIPFPLVALAQSQTYAVLKTLGPGDIQFIRFMDALQTYCGPWRNTGVFYDSNFTHKHWTIFQFVLRWFGPGSRTPSDAGPETGIRCDRETGSFETKDGKKIEFEERRLWLSFKACTNATTKIADDPKPFKTQLPPCTGFFFSDDVFLPEPSDVLWERSRLISCREGSGVALFQFYVLRALVVWEKEWNGSLSQVDMLLRVEVRNAKNQSYPNSWSIGY